MSDLFDKLKKSIEKNVKGVHASVMADSDIVKNRYWVKTPAYDLNRILSGNLHKGLQSRNLCGIIGPEHTMKTSFMILCMVEAIKEGKQAIIIDTEGGCNAEFCARWGLDLNNVFYTYTPFVSEVKSILGQIREAGETDMIIGLDSVGNLERLKQFEDAEGGKLIADQGLLQKEIKGMLKLFLNICIAQNSIGIATGHLYGKPAKVPMPDQIGGGKAMKLLPSILINLKKTPLTVDGNKDSAVVGAEIQASTIKNRMYPPFQTAKVQLDYKNGVQPFAGILDLAIEAEFVEKKGSWYSYGDERLGQGYVNAVEALKEFPDILDKLNDWLKGTGYSTISKEIEEAEQLLQNEMKEKEHDKINKKDDKKTEG